MSGAVLTGLAGAADWRPYGALGLVGALVAALIVLRRLERGAVPFSMRSLRAETDRAIAGSDAPLFFAIGRTAVQARLAARWGCLGASITVSDLRSRGVAATLQAFFEMADAVAYSGRSVSQEEMRRWQEVILAEIARL